MEIAKDNRSDGSSLYTDMIRINPEVDLAIACPGCSQEWRATDWLITGMHSLCGMECPQCQKSYYAEMPVNAGLFYPGMIDRRTGARCDRLSMDNWYLRSLQQGFKERHETPISFEVERLKPRTRRRLAVLNTVDSTYGHALFELFNATHYLRQNDLDLIILVQKNLRWLVPLGAAEVWSVDLPFSRPGEWNMWLAQRIKAELGSSEAFLCRSFVQTDSSDAAIEDFSGVQPFPLEKWDELLMKPTVTFIWRSDRFWRRVLPKAIDNRWTRRWIPNLIVRLRHYFQFRWILSFSQALKQNIPNVDFAVAGMDSRDRALPSWIKDFRFAVHSNETARAQCQRYAESHLIVGCNGSSLILPGCHAGGVVNIVPGDQWAVSAGSFPFRITSTGDTHFRYVMLPAEVSVQRVVSVCTALLRDRSYILLQTTSPWRDHKAKLDSFAWSRFRSASFDLGKHFKSAAGLVTDRRHENGYQKP